MYKHIGSEGCICLTVSSTTGPPGSANTLWKTKRPCAGAAKQFGVSKSTVHKDVSQRLKYLDSGLYRDVKNVLAVNKAQRHIRGGLATKKKYQALK